MPRIDYLLLGYRRINYKSEDRTALVNLLLKNGFSVKLNACDFLIPEHRYKSLRRVMDGVIEYSASPPLGLYGTLCSHKKSYGLIAGILISLMLLALSGSVVWDVRVEGTDDANKDAICRELEGIGFGVGSLWRNVDKSALEAEMLAESSYVSWININRRGGVAYVKVMDKLSYDSPPPLLGYANIVAARDAVIEDITVKSGTALVKKGETVKRGQILISGVIPEESGGGYCHAEGSVTGRYSEDISVSVERTEKEKTLDSSRFSSFSLKIFGKEINIFKIYRNYGEDCDIMKDERNIYFLGGTKLPLAFINYSLLKYTEKEKLRTDDEMISEAADRLREQLRATLRDKELLKLKTSGEFSEDVYKMHTDIVCTSDIGQVLVFTVD